ncbi:DUF4031 domain-containing protein [Micromonospora polyrhachis]|uniref:DUF4031 domain-containing protein n=1 Tax=Micromonospora polyrhachis TaxID=1282883 RepID=A0A7W7SX26_9ACTN|nr:DUF4031 domain-containing protein [Micromonospora polyrhachis]MBB4961245.1 hypothetical protein [Micromonospora polyrhachis]
MLYVDQPAWPAHGRLWSHLVSDVSYAELHAFAEMLGAPRRAFDRDHYDLPAERFVRAVWLGAQVVSSREIVELLYRSGLRLPKHLARPSKLVAKPSQMLAQSVVETSVASSRVRLARADSSQRSASAGSR